MQKANKGLKVIRKVASLMNLTLNCLTRVDFDDSTAMYLLDCFFRWLDWVIAQKTTKVVGTEVGRNDLGVTMTSVLEILKQANRPLDKAYAKDIFNVRTLLFNLIHVKH